MAVFLSLREVFLTSSGFMSRSRGLLGVCIYAGLGVVMFGLSLPSYTSQLDRATFNKVPKVFHTFDRKLDGLKLTSSYGLFRSMTGVGGRPEVILEGTNNLHGAWQEYQFKYKPGNISVAPEFLLPHQPRLDWQMWFAALGSYNNNPWLLSLVYRLLEGRQEVLDLLNPASPFTTSPPKYLRAKLYKYHYTPKNSQAWWWREEQGEYLPILTRDHRPLKEMLTSQGLLDLPRQKEANSKSFISQQLAGMRKMVRLGPPDHIQIWSFAWLTLPILKPFII